MRRDRAHEPLEISLVSFEPLPRELVARAAAVGIDRLIWYPLVPVDRLETAVRQLGAQFGTAP